jgi:hypothetical protein
VVITHDGEALLAERLQRFSRSSSLRSSSMVWLCLLIATPTTKPMAKQINSFIENTSLVAWIVERNYLTSLRQSVSRAHDANISLAAITE